MSDNWFDFLKLNLNISKNKLNYNIMRKLKSQWRLSKTCKNFKSKKLKNKKNFSLKKNKKKYNLLNKIKK